MSLAEGPLRSTLPLEVDVLRPSAHIDLVPNEPVAYEQHFRVGEVLTTAVNDLLLQLMQTPMAVAPPDPFFGLAARLAGVRDVPRFAGLRLKAAKVSVLMDVRGCTVQLHDFARPPMVDAGSLGALSERLAGVEADALPALEAAVTAAGLPEEVVAELMVAGAAAAAVSPLEWWSACTGREVAPLQVALRVGTFGGVWVGVVAEDPAPAIGALGPRRAPGGAVAQAEVLLDEGWTVCLGLSPDQHELTEAQLQALEARGVVVLDDPDLPGFPRAGVAAWSLRPTCWVANCATPAQAWAAAAAGQPVVVDPHQLAALPLPKTRATARTAPGELALQQAYEGVMPYADGVLELQDAGSFAPAPREEFQLPPARPQSADLSPLAEARPSADVPDAGVGSGGVRELGDGRASDRVRASAFPSGAEVPEDSDSSDD